MRLDEVQSGPVYVDTNVLYMYLRADPEHLATVRTFLERMVRGRLEAHVSVLALDELFYRLLLARVKDAVGRNPLDVLREDAPGTINAHWRPIKAALAKLLSLPHMNLAGVEASSVPVMLDNIRLYSLLPRDALHIAVMQQLGITAVASDDADFDRVPGLERHWVFRQPAG